MQYAVFPDDYQIFPQNVLKMSSKYPNSKAYLDVPINQNYIICSSWCPVGSSLGKCGFFFEKRPFFQADMAGLGEILHGQIWPDWGPCRDIYVIKISLPSVRYFLFCTMCALP